MELKEYKTVEMFKFTNERGGQVNIYIEPTDTNKGRLIISTAYTIYQRFFDGAGGGIYKFVSELDVSQVPDVFEKADEYDKKCLLRDLKEVWPKFTKLISSRI